MAYKRVLLKLSGEALMGSRQYGIDPLRLSEYANDIKEALAEGIQIAIVIGGGNIFRGVAAASNGIDRVQGDHMGMLATVNNENIELYDYIDESVGITEIIFQRKNINGAYEEIGRSEANTNQVFFLDEDANPSYRSWEYRTKYIDSCGTEGTFANVNKTIFLEGSSNEYDMILSLIHI